MNTVAKERLAQLRSMIGEELRLALFGEMPKFCMAINMPADKIAEIASQHGLPQDEVLALAWSMVSDFTASACWPD